MKTYTADQLDGSEEDIKLLLEAQTLLNPLGYQLDPSWDDEPGFGFYGEFDPAKEAGIRCTSYFGWIPLSVIKQTSLESLPRVALAQCVEDAFAEGKDHFRRTFKELIFF